MRRYALGLMLVVMVLLLAPRSAQAIPAITVGDPEVLQICVTAICDRTSPQCCTHCQGQNGVTGGFGALVAPGNINGTEPELLFETQEKLCSGIPTACSESMVHSTCLCNPCALACQAYSTSVPFGNTFTTFITDPCINTCFAFAIIPTANNGEASCLEACCTGFPCGTGPGALFFEIPPGGTFTSPVFESANFGGDPPIGSFNISIAPEGTGAPEIDAATATLPVLLIAATLAIVADRRRRFVPGR